VHVVDQSPRIIAANHTSLAVLADADCTDLGVSNRVLVFSKGL